MGHIVGSEIASHRLSRSRILVTIPDVKALDPAHCGHQHSHGISAEA
jgi:hypothetical protein